MKFIFKRASRSAANSFITEIALDRRVTYFLGEQRGQQTQRHPAGQAYISDLMKRGIVFRVNSKDSKLINDFALDRREPYFFG